MTTLAIALAVLATGLLLWLLLTPLVLEGRFQGSLAEGFRLRGQLRFWPIAVRLPRGRAEPAAEAKAKAPEAKPAKPGDGRRRFARLRRHYALGELVAFLRGALRHVRVETLEGRVDYGFSDPARTGTTYGIASALLAALGPRARVQVVPSWTFENRCVADVRLDVRIPAARLLLATGWFLLTHYRRRADLPAGAGDAATA